MTSFPKHRIHSFRAALTGLAHVIKYEANFQIELFFAGLAVILGAVLKISQGEWMLLALIVSFILVLELVNTAFEHLADVQKPRLDPVVKLAKDVSAAAVLVASLGALIVGILLFGPKLANLMGFGAGLLY